MFLTDIRVCVSDPPSSCASYSFALEGRMFMSSILRMGCPRIVESMGAAVGVTNAEDGAVDKLGACGHLWNDHRRVRAQVVL